ncbi:class I SAM-dependent methyltransferase [Nicoliella spurrieriana]|uniref:class I SAM-dependent methyltransferase n=1 Tax=Nicoliella spurrieriana TaxID=2925830 RepID=UPI00311AB147
MKSALAYSHTLLQSVVQAGDVVVDATVGNGHDTEFLANLVGPSGRVYGFDVQQLAIDNTTARLKNSNLLSRVRLFHQGHEQIEQVLAKDVQIKGAMFNLGYLPGGDHQMITNGATTIKAIKACLTRLTPSGIIGIVLYYGHPGGLTEKNAVMKFANQLPQKQFTVLQYQFINQVNEPPILLAIQKR